MSESEKTEQQQTIEFYQMILADLMTRQTTDANVKSSIKKAEAMIALLKEGIDPKTAQVQVFGRSK